MRIFPNIAGPPCKVTQASGCQQLWKKPHEHVDAHGIADGCADAGLRLRGVHHSVQDSPWKALQGCEFINRGKPTELANPVSASPVVKICSLHYCFWRGFLRVMHFGLNFRGWPPTTLSDARHTSHHGGAVVLAAADIDDNPTFS